jgi:hypothetical protein
MSIVGKFWLQKIIQSDCSRVHWVAIGILIGISARVKIFLLSRFTGQCRPEMNVEATEENCRKPSRYAAAFFVSFENPRF